MNAGSEWTKLWTVRSSWLNIAAAVVLTTLLGVDAPAGLDRGTSAWRCRPELSDRH